MNARPSNHSRNRGARPSRALVSASRRNNLELISSDGSPRKRDAFANARDGRAPLTLHFSRQFQPSALSIGRSTLLLRFRYGETSERLPPPTCDAEALSVGASLR